MNITKVLSDEHQKILKVIDGVLKKCIEIEKDEQFDPEFFTGVIDFIKNYADGIHHAKEEDILFKAMLENLQDMHCNPIPVMLHEHDEGRIYVKGLQEGIDNSNVEQILANARGYCFLLQEHIYKEDNVLYPMAEQLLSEEQKKLIQLKYIQIGEGSYSEKNIQNYLDKASIE